MATATDYKRLRADVGANHDALGDVECSELFTEAGETYTTAPAIKAEARVLAIQRILASAAKLTDYAQDTTQEKSSQVFDHLNDLLTYWIGERDKARTIELRTVGRGAAKFAGRRVRPARIKEYPNA